MCQIFEQDNFVKQIWTTSPTNDNGLKQQEAQNLLICNFVDNQKLTVCFYLFPQEINNILDRHFAFLNDKSFVYSNAINTINKKIVNSEELSFLSAVSSF